MRKFEILLSFALLALNSCADGGESNRYAPGTGSGVTIPGGHKFDAGVVNERTPYKTPTRVYFQLNGDGYSALLDGSNVEKVCDQAAPKPSQNGLTVLCVPATTETPLTLYTLESSETLADVEEWTGSENHPPRIAPDGSRFVYSTYNAAEHAYTIRLTSDTGRTLGEVPGDSVVDFPDDDQVVFNKTGNAYFWLSGQEPLQIPNAKYLICGPDPLGAAYTKQGINPQTFFFSADTGSSKLIAPGEVVATFGTRVLLRSSGNNNDARIYDIVDSTYSESINIPSGLYSYSGQRIQFLDEGAIIVESKANCTTLSEKTASLKTTFVDVENKVTTLLAETETPHRFLIDRARRHKVRFESDACGSPTGAVTISPLNARDESNTLDLAALFSDRRISAVALTEDGSTLALGTTAGLSLLDLNQNPPVLKNLNLPEGAVFGEILFR